MESKPYYPILESEIAKNGIKKQDIAKRLNISSRSFSKKITGNADFWWNEVRIISSIFPNVPTVQLFSSSDEVRDNERR